MAGQEKVIQFTFKIDEQSLSRLKNEIRDVTTAMSKLVQVASGMSPGAARGGPIAMGTGGPTTTGGTAAAIRTQNQQGAGGLSQAFVEAGRSMKDMANLSRDSLRMMTEGVGRAIGEQRRQLGSLDADLKRVIADYNNLGEAAKQSASGDTLQGMHAKLLTQRQGVSGNIDKLSEQQQGITRAYLDKTFGPAGAPPGAAGAGPGGHGGEPGGPSGPRPGGFARGAAMVGATVAAVGTIGSEVMHQFRDPIEISARRGELARSRLENLMSGDFRSSFAMKNLSVEQKRDIAEQTRSLARVEQTGLAAKHMAGAVPLAGQLIGTGGESQMSGLGHGAGFKGDVQETAMAENALKLADRTRQGGRGMMMDMAIGRWQGQVDDRVSMKRQMGVRSLHQDPKTGEWVDPYAAMTEKLTAGHYTSGELRSATMGMKQAAGARAGGQYGWEAMAANAEGLGGYSDLLGASVRAGGSNRFARGAIGGGIDRYAGVQLGQAILGSGFDATGTTSGVGSLSAIQAGMGFTGGSGDFRKSQQVAAGMQLGSSVVGGGLDQYQSGRNLAAAIGIKGGSDVYTQDYLANGMNMRQMMDAARGGELTDTAQALGLSSKDIRAQLGESVSSVLDERMPGVDDKSPMGKAMAAYQASGQDLPAYLSGLKGNEKKSAVKNLGVAYGIATGQGSEGGIGAMGAMAGLDEKTTMKLGGVGGSADTMEAKADKAKAAMEGVANEALRAAAATGNLTKALDEAPKDFSIFQDFGTNLHKASDEFIGELGRMTGLIKEYNDRMGAAPAVKAAAQDGGNSVSVVRGGKAAG